MAATYGSLPPSEGSDVEMVLDDTIVRQPEQKSFFALAMKTSLAVLLFAGISIMAVSVSRSYDGLTSNQASVEFDTDVFGRVTYSLLTDEQQESLFNDFISTYNRDYAQQAEEYEKRLAVFKTNLALADVRNAKEAAINGSGVHGVTKFSDLTSEEFVSTYLMQETSESAERRKNRRSRKAEESETPNRIAGSDPTLIYVDWTDDTTTDVKNMGSCGGSWAIAAVEQIESDAIKEGIISADRPLSAQQLLSCVSGQQGCTYGSIEDAYENVKKPGGSYFASDYPYTSSEGDVPDCVTVEKNYALTIGGYFSLNTDGNTYNTERLILNHVTNDGTLSACLDATTWSTYVSGTMGSCDGNEINHCIQIVGVYYSSAEDTGFYKVYTHLAFCFHISHSNIICSDSKFMGN